MASENDLPDNDDVKKKALMRLAVAGLVTATALAGLWWLDQGKQAPSGTAAPAPQPTPIQSASPPAPTPPQTELPPTAAGEVATAESVQPTPETPADAGAPREAPPPPQVSNAPRQLPADVQPPPRPSPPTSTPAPSPASKQTPVATIPQGGGSFVVQLGVFNNLAHAEELVRRLRQQGIHASTETRVHVGPFLNREEAEKARIEMRRLGLNGVITTVAPTK